MDVNNPKILKPNILVLYNIENKNEYYTYKIVFDRICSQEEMEHLGYPSPNGSYIIYKLKQKINIKTIDVVTFLD